MTSATIGVVVHAGRAASLSAAAAAARSLTTSGATIVVADDPAVADGQGDGLAEIGPVVGAAEFSAKADLAMSFGGDGTFMRAAHLARDAGVPVLGVNLGRLGFLAEVEVDEMVDALERIVAGDYLVEARSTLEVDVVGPDGTVSSGWALNEVSVEKTARQRLLRMDVSVSGEHFAKVPADALVVATSTGSTAYALSAGGPIVSPRIEATLVVPVAPHTLFDRTIVVGPDELVEIELASDQAPALVSCDGREPLEIEAGMRVLVRGGGRPVLLARLTDLDFYGLVRRKFGLR